MKKTISLLFLLLLGYQMAAQETKDSVSVEYLKPIKISTEKQNEYTGEYSINGKSGFVIEVKLRDDGMSIIIPDTKNPDSKITTTWQYGMEAQYEDKFYLKSNAFIKVHFTRSKKTKKIISLLFNANRDDSEQVIRATKIK